MNRLLRAGFSSRAIYKVLREWELPEELVEGIEAEGLAQPEERAGDSDSYARQNEDED
jgi:regulatory protein